MRSITIGSILPPSLLVILCVLGMLIFQFLYQVSVLLLLLLFFAFVFVVLFFRNWDFWKTRFSIKGMVWPTGKVPPILGEWNGHGEKCLWESHTRSIPFQVCSMSRMVLYWTARRKSLSFPLHVSWLCFLKKSPKSGQQGGTRHRFLKHTSSQADLWPGTRETTTSAEDISSSLTCSSSNTARRSPPERFPQKMGW